jgi:hypothetical protein
VDLDDILYEGVVIEYYLNYLLFNPVASAIPKGRTFKLLRWVLLLNWSVDLDEMLYADDNTEGNVDSILPNPVTNHSKIADV